VVLKLANIAIRQIPLALKLSDIWRRKSRANHPCRLGDGCIPFRGLAGTWVVSTLPSWSGKTLADHRSDRRDWLLVAIGITEPDPGRYQWAPVVLRDPDHMPPAQRLLHVVADRNGVGSCLPGTPPWRPGA
jgi:hypothetical protein